MYGDESYGVLCYGDATDAAAESLAWQAFLAEVLAERCWLLELDAFALASSGARSSEYGDAAYGEMGYGDADAGVSAGVVTLRWSDRGFTTRASDAPASTHYDARLAAEVSIERRIAGRSGIGGLVRTTGQVSLINADGALDALTRDYSIGGRRVRLLIGRPGDALADFGAVFTGVAREPQTGTAHMVLQISDGAAKLEVPVNQTVYAGTGGTEGGSDLKGKPKPRGWGHVYNISPPLVDAAGLVYQANDGPISDVPAVYDRGVALTKVVGAPAAGQYSVDAAAGTFTLGATPAGTVTCDALLDASGAGYVDSTADIVLRLLGLAGLASDEIDPASFSNLDSAAPAEVGIWTGTEPRTVDELIDTLLAGVGAFGGFNRLGAFSVAVLAEPVGTPKDAFGESDILDLEILPLPPEVEPLAWRCAVAWQRSYTVQDDLAASVSAARRTFAAQGVRVAASQDGSILSRHLLARDYSPLEDHYAQEADAQAEAARRFSLWSRGRRQARLKLPARAMARALGDLVRLEHRRLGFGAGLDARVLALRLERARVQMEVLV